MSLQVLLLVVASLSGSTSGSVSVPKTMIESSEVLSATAALQAAAMVAPTIEGLTPMVLYRDGTPVALATALKVEDVTRIITLNFAFQAFEPAMFSCAPLKWLGADRQYVTPPAPVVSEGGFSSWLMIAGLGNTASQIVSNARLPRHKMSGVAMRLKDPIAITSLFTGRQSRIVAIVKDQAIGQSGVLLTHQAVGGIDEDSLRLDVGHSYADNKGGLVVVSSVIKVPEALLENLGIPGQPVALGYYFQAKFQRQRE